MNERRYAILVKNENKHLHDHLGSCPLRQIKDIKQSILNVRINDEGKDSLSIFSSADKVARKELTYMIVLHDYPLAMVKHFWFRMFVGAIQPLFKSI